MNLTKEVKDLYWENDKTLKKKMEEDANKWMYTRSVQKVSSHVIWKIETFIEEDTRYKKHCI